MAKEKDLYSANIKLYKSIPEDKKIIDNYLNNYHRLPFITYLLTMVEKQVEEENRK